MRSYRLFFVPRTEDELVRHGALPSSEEQAALPARREAKKARFEAFVERRKEELQPVLVEKEKERAEEKKRLEEEEEKRKIEEAEKDRVAEEEKLKSAAAASAAAEMAAAPAAVQEVKMDEDKPAIAAVAHVEAHVEPVVASAPASSAAAPETTTAATPAPVVEEDVKMSDA